MPLPPRVRPALPTLSLLVLGLLLVHGTTLAAQVVNPAHSGASQADDDEQDAAAQDAQVADDDDYGAPRLRTWELPAVDPIVVTAGSLREEELVGAYRQPRWTTRRLFGATRVYVRPEGTVQYEHWTRVKTPRHGPTSVVSEHEIEIGLPGRWQIDIYESEEKEGSRGPTVDSQSFEVRYALADWGELWGNPTLYYEYVQRDGENNLYEAKLLLADELSPSWHWGTNLVVEREFGSQPETVYEITAGLSHTVQDRKLAVGGELKAALVDAHDGNGSDRAEEFEIGPSLRWMPIPQFHLDLAALAGIGGDSRKSDVYLVLGWEF